MGTINLPDTVHPTFLGLIIFLAFFVGYAWGRRYGHKEGYQVGIKYAPLELRRTMWIDGRCVICGSSATEGEVSALEEESNVADGKIASQTLG